MQRRSLIQAAIAASIAPWLAAPAFAQKYPDGAVTIIMPLEAGSASDVAVRYLATALGAQMSASFVVENVTGAAGIIGLNKVDRARPDGQTLAALNNSIMTILPHLQPKNIKVDTRKEFVPIAGIANIPTFFAVPGNSPIRTIKDLVELARKKPGTITYSSGGVGSPQHLATEMFMSYAGVKLFHVPYKGANQAAVALASGEVQVMSMALSLAKPFLGDGRVRLIGYCGMQRHAQFPNIPTLDEQGVANYDYSSWIGLFAQKDVPADVVATLRREAAPVVNDKAFQAQLTKSGLDPWPRSPEELMKIVPDDYAKWQKIIVNANIAGPDGLGAERPVRIAGYQGSGSILTRSLHELRDHLAALGRTWDPQVEDDVTAIGEPAASLFRSVDNGRRQICYLASGYLASAVPSLGVLDLPFSVDDRNAALHALDNEGGAHLSADVARKTGYHVLAFWDNGFRHLTNGVRPIVSASDCAGLRIRTLDNALYREVLAAMGFRPVTTDVKDLVRAVAQREVDAQENPLTNFINFGLWRDHPHVSLTSHFFGVLLLVCHRPWFESLTAAQQDLLRHAAQKATQLQRSLAANEDEISLRFLAQNAVSVLKPNELDLASMRHATRAIAARERARFAPDLVRSYLDHSR